MKTDQTIRPFFLRNASEIETGLQQCQFNELVQQLSHEISISNKPKCQAI